MEQNTLELTPELKRAYAEVEVSPYLLSRVMASTAESSRKSFPVWKFAGGMLSISLVLLLLVNTHDENAAIQYKVATGVPVSFSIPSLHVPVSADYDAPVPGLSSLGGVPSMSQFQTPVVSLSSAGSFCIYKTKGDKLC